MFQGQGNLDIDKIYLYVKDPFEWKYQLLINGRENIEIENLKNWNAFIELFNKVSEMF